VKQRIEGEPRVSNLKAGAVTICISVLLAIFASGCGNGGTPVAGNSVKAPQEKAATTDSTQPPSLKPATLRIYMHLTKDFFDTYIADPVKKKYPSLTLEYLNSLDKDNNLSQLIASNQTPDIIWNAYGVISQMKDLGLQYDLTPLIKKYNVDLSHIDTNLINSLKQYSDNGQELYGFPTARASKALMYNKDIFDKFGVPYPKDGIAWDDVAELAKKLTRTDGGIQYYGIGTSQLNLMGTELPLTYFNKEGKADFSSSVWKTYATMYKTIKTLDSTPRANSVNGFILDKDIAMVPSGTSSIFDKAAEVEGSLNWDLATFPVFKNAPTVGPGGLAHVYGIASTSKYKDEAFQVISYFISDEMQMVVSQEATFVPASNRPEILAQFASKQPIIQKRNVQALFKLQTSIDFIHPYKSIADKHIKAEFDSMKKGVDENTALRNAEEKTNKDIAALNQ
jgi:multiple sugar transport system substrate-binding protein